MRILCIYSYFIGIEIVFNYAVGLNEAYLETSAMGWWEARKGCIEDGSDLFVPSETISVPSQVGINTYYWVGGFETSQWRWTDNSLLFTLIGQYNIPNVEGVEIAGNSVIECYRESDGECKVLGLSGSLCYCLEDVDVNEEYKGPLNMSICPGNQDEECGTDSSMSVYEIDIDFSADADEDGHCGYAHVSSGDVKLKSWKCHSELFSVCEDPPDSIRRLRECENNLCLTVDSNSWFLSNQTCTLAKVTSSTKENVGDLLVGKENRYWVGLYKSITRRWASGEEVEDHFYTRFTHPGPRCLALFVTHSTWYAHWIPCIVELPSLCTKGQNTNGTVDMLSEGDSTDIVTMPTFATRGHGETEPTPLENTRTVEVNTEVTTEKGGNNKTAGMVEGNDMVPDKNVKNIGVIVGAILGVVVLVTVTLVIIVLQRKGKFCFERQNRYENKHTTENIVGAENDYYNTDGVHRTDNGRDNMYINTGSHDYSNVMVDTEQEAYNTTANSHVVNVDNGLSGQNAETYARLDACSESGKGNLDAKHIYTSLTTDVDNDDNTTRPGIDNVQNDTYSNTVTVNESQGSDTEGALSLQDYYNLQR